MEQQEKSIMKPEVKKTESADRFLDLYTQVTDEDFYEVTTPDGKKRKEPSAKALQKWANEKRISTKILESEKNENGVRVRLAGWIGELSNPLIYKEAEVNIDFKIKGQQWLVQQYYKKRINLKFEDGVPIPADSNSQFKFFQYMLNLKDFALRICITKCESILYRKLLSLEFREKEEIELEKDEVEEIAKSQESENQNINETPKKEQDISITPAQKNAIESILKSPKKESIIEFMIEFCGTDDISRLSKEQASKIISFANSI